MTRRPHRSFDPVRVGRLETTTWVTYYRHEWLKFLRAAIAVTRHAFGLSWPATLYGAWLVLRANQLWAPPVDNDPEGARRTMERFYRLLRAKHSEERFDPAQASRLEVEWWRVHRIHQRSDNDLDEQALIEALTALYAYVDMLPLLREVLTEHKAASEGTAPTTQCLASERPPRFV